MGGEERVWTMMDSSGAKFKMRWRIDVERNDKGKLTGFKYTQAGEKIKRGEE
jgi:hypothetical protein